MRQLLAHPLIILALTFLVVLFVISLQKTAQKSRVASENVRLIEEKNAELTIQIEAGQQALDNAGTDLAKEKILRNELLLQKPGEYVIQIPDELIIQQQSGEIQEKSPWQQWQDLLF
jgi:hypothetical protein